MPPLTVAQFPDSLDARFTKIVFDEFSDVPDMITEFFDVSGLVGPQRHEVRYSEVGAFGDFPELEDGSSYVPDDVFEGYISTIAFKQYASGFQVSRTLFEDEQYGIMDQLPRALGKAAARTKQKHAATIFNNAFGLDTTWLTRGEGLALCSNSHTTTSGASVAAGFDNLLTAALSAVSLQAAKIQMQGFRDDRANLIDVQPDTLITPIDLEEVAYELIASAGKVDTANNNANIHKGRYTHKQWIRLTDVNNWFLADNSMLKDSFKFINRVPLEMAMVEDFDNYTGRWRARQRYGLGWRSWRPILGSQVS